MKKILPILFVCMMWTGTSYAQDLIVTTAGDSIYCKITRERDGFVYFSYNKEGVPTNTLIVSGMWARKALRAGSTVCKVDTPGALHASATSLRPG
jgi:hypothetical protein